MALKTAEQSPMRKLA